MSRDPAPAVLQLPHTGALSSFYVGTLFAPCPLLNIIRSKLCIVKWFFDILSELILIICLV